MKCRGMQTSFFAFQHRIDRFAEVTIHGEIRGFCRLTVTQSIRRSTDLIIHNIAREVRCCSSRIIQEARL